VGKVHFGFLAAAMFSLTSIVGCAADTSGDGSTEGVGESQDHLLAGRRLSEREAATLIRQAGFPESSVGKMLCTIKYESNFYERASNKNRNGSVDYGLFQINSIHFGKAGCPSSASALYSAATNTKCALSIYRSQGINAWYGYQKHRSECDRYAAPSGSATPNAGAPDDQTDTSADGGCYSGTLEEMMPASTCVESKFDGLWYQCKAGHWARGGDNGSGPNGACSSKHPL
jgi:lysozyme C